MCTPQCCRIHNALVVTVMAEADLLLCHNDQVEDTTLGSTEQLESLNKMRRTVLVPRVVIHSGQTGDGSRRVLLAYKDWDGVEDNAFGRLDIERLIKSGSESFFRHGKFHMDHRMARLGVWGPDRADHNRIYLVD